MVPERFPFVYIADVYFYHRGRDGTNGIGQGDRSMGQRARVEHDAVGRKPNVVQVIEQGTLMVALEINEFDAQKSRLQLTKKRLKRLASINIWLAPAQKVEVGAVDDVDGHR